MKRPKRGRYTPPKIIGCASRDGAHDEIGRRIGAHLDLHKTWEGPLHGNIVRITVDRDGKIHHRILRKA